MKVAPWLKAHGNEASAIFLWGSLILLTAVALSKLYASMQEHALLAEPDPILPLTIRQVTFGAALLECVIAIAIVRAKDEMWKFAWLAILAGVFLTYRISVYLLHPPMPCPCLGVLPSLFHLTQQQSDHMAKAILGYWLVGSYFFLIVKRR